MALPITSILTRITNNKHTSTAAATYVAAKAAASVAVVWFPARKEQIDATMSAIESAAVGYGLLMAGDSKPQNQTTQPENEPNNPKA